jgi:hypothetical protein
MYDLLGIPIGVAAGRELAMSAMPDAPVIADDRRRGRRRPRREDGQRGRTAPTRQYAEHLEVS